MIHLSAYLHREQFQEIVGRWFYNDLQPSDALDVKYIVNFNSILIRRYLRGLAGRLFRDVYRVEPSSFHVHTKGELKDFVADHPTVTNAHIQDMIAAYRERPEDFYKETPIDGRVFYADEGAHTMFLGSARLKRPRRIAEKGGRRISDFVYQRIRDNAEKLARDRAERLRIPLEHLVSSHEQMVQEFAEAEDLIRQTIKTHRQPILEHTFDIHDVAGLKLVGEHDVQEEIVRYIEAAPDLTLLEREEHRGLYNATNLTVEMRLDRARLLAEPIDEKDLAVLQMRGFDPRAALHDLHTFVKTGEDRVVVEIILADFEEFLESEIGRCQHEGRIRAQRQNEIYRGPLAKNAQYLLTYLFAFAVSPQTSIEELPIKLWGNYVPDYIDLIIRQLYNVYEFTVSF